MRKSDQSIHNVVSASVRRHSIDIDSWGRTKLWDSGVDGVQTALASACGFGSGEMPILYTYLDSENWTVYSTRAVYYANDGRAERLAVEDIENYDWDVAVFTGLAGVKVDSLKIITRDGRTHEALYETGNPSMGAIYSIMTLLAVGRAWREPAA